MLNQLSRCAVAVSAIVLLVVVSLLTLPATSNPPVSFSSHPAQATVKLLRGDGASGSAIPVQCTPQGLTILLTAKHIVEGATQSAMMVEVGSTWLPVCRVEQHPILDIAAVWVQHTLPVVPVDYSPISFGERLMAAGFLFGDLFHLAEGLVSIPGHMSIDILPGCSGGPVLRDGRVVGILVQCIIAQGTAIGAQAIFVQISEAREWLSGILR